MIEPKELRAAAEDQPCIGGVGSMLRQAADEIEQLREEVADLKAQIHELAELARQKMGGEA